MNLHTTPPKWVLAALIAMIALTFATPRSAVRPAVAAGTTYTIQATAVCCGSSPGTFSHTYTISAAAGSTFDLINGGSFSGTGFYDPDPSQTESITGTLMPSGALTATVTYLNGSGYVSNWTAQVTAASSTSGTVSGTFSDSLQQNGTLSGTIVAASPLPDLTVPAFTAPASAAAGATITITATIANQGSGDAAYHHDEAVLSTSNATAVPTPSDDIVLTAHDEAAIAAGGGYTGSNPSVPIPSSVTPGNYYICYVVNYLPGDNVVETSMTNNRTCQPIIITSGSSGGGGSSGGATGCVTPPAGLVSWWTGDGTANDLLNTNNPTQANAGFAAGEVGQGIAFNGTAGQRVLLPDSPSLDQQNFTIDLWATRLGDGLNEDDPGPVLLQKDTDPSVSGAGLSYSIWWSGSTNQISAEVGVTSSTSGLAAGPSVKSTHTFPPNSTLFIAITHDTSGTLTLYVNGVQEGQTTLAGALQYGSGPLTMGGTSDLPSSQGFPRTFNGVIDEVEFFSRALSAAELNGIYGAGAAGKCKSPVPSNGGAGSFLPDLTVPSFSAPASAAAGSTITITATIANQGKGGAAYHHDEAVLSTSNATDVPTRSDDIFLTAHDEAAIAAGGSYTGSNPSVPIPSSVTPGNYYICYVTNYLPTDNVAETSMTNDRNCQAITITSGSSGGTGGTGGTGGSGGSGGTSGCTPPSTSTQPQLLGSWVGDGNATDSSGNHNDGTRAAGAPYAPGIHGHQAFRITGGGDVVTVPDSASLNVPDCTPITLEAWAYPTNLTPPQHLLGKREGCGGGPFYQLAIGSLALPTPAANAWSHLVLTQDADNLVHTYINGVEVGSPFTAPANVGPTSGVPLLIGDSGACAPFLGCLTELKVWQGIQAPTGPDTSIPTGGCTDASGGNSGGTGSTATCTSTGSNPVAGTPPAGLVAYWRADGTAVDAAGTNNGTLQGGAGYTPGQFGQAFCLNGSTAYVQAPDSNLWAFGSSDFTISLWAYFNAVPPASDIGHPSDMFIGNDEGPGDVSKWFFAYGGGVLNFGTDNPGDGGGAFLAQTPFSPQANRWYHLSVRRQGGVYTTFYDNVRGTSEAFCHTSPNPNAPLTIGQAEGLGFVNGAIDEVQIFNRALSDAELGVSGGSSAAAAPCSGYGSTGGSGSGGGLDFTKSGPAYAYAGEQLTYVLKVKNSDPNPATNVVIDDAFPNGLQFVSVSSDHPAATCAWDNVQHVICTLPSLASGDIWTVTIIAQAPQPAPVHNDATLTATSGGGSPITLTGGAGTDVVQPVGLGLTKSVKVLTGPKLQYTIDVVNEGPTVAHNVVAKDILDPQWVLLSATATKGTCHDRVICDVGDLAVGEKETATIVIALQTVVPGETVHNTATGSCDECPPVTGGADAAPFPDLRVSKAHQGSFVAGSTATYTISVSNVGTGPTTDAITVADTLPTGESFVSSSGADFTCTAGGQMVTCTRTTPLGAGQSASFMLTVALAADAPNSITNYVTLSGGGGVWSPDLVGDGGTPIIHPSLGVTKKVSATTITVGHNLTYIIDVTNTGTVDVHNVKALDNLPGDEDLVSVSTTVGSCTSTAPVSCDFGTLPVGQYAEVTIVVKPKTLTILTNQATGWGDGVQPVTSGGVSTTVVGPPDVGVTKTPSAPVVIEDSTLLYTIVAKNLGPGDATNVTINDPLPRGVELLSVQTDPTFGMSCNVTAPPTIPSLSGPVSCTIPTLPYLKTSTLVLKIHVLVVGPLGNTVCVSSDDPDPTPDNNCSTANSRVEGITVDAHGPYTVSEASSVPLNGSAVRDDGTSSGLTYAWDLDGDGTFETAGQNPTFSAATLDGPSVKNIALQVCDGNIGCVVARTTVTITNVPPKISSATNTGPVVAGKPATITVTASDVAGPVRDPLGYEFDCNNDGTYEVGPQSGNTAPCIFPNPGQYTVTVRVNDGDGGTDTSTTDVIVYGYPANGQFVIGDGEPHGVGVNVNFSGSQWWKNNTLSATAGNEGPAAFKGFDATSAAPMCGQSWTTDPGNSAPPPGTVPSYLAVIVSSQVSQSGSTISGDIKQIVIVKTDPGYAGNPGHPGTGTVVAVLCGGS